MSLKKLGRVIRTAGVPLNTGITVMFSLYAVGDKSNESSTLVTGIFSIAAGAFCGVMVRRVGKELEKIDDTPDNGPANNADS